MMKHEEWENIYQLYKKSLFLYALSLTKNVQDAEDLIQETFVKAFLSYKSAGSIKYWLITVLKNEYLNLLKKRKREILNAEKEQRGESSKDDMVEQIICQEERRKLFQAIQELPLAQKEILMESVYFHLPDETIAKMHDTTKENVRKIRSRAKQKLIAKIRRDYDGRI